MCGRHHSQFLKLRRELLLFIKAEMSSVVATAVDYGVTILLTEGLGIYYALSNLVGCVSGRSDQLLHQSEVCVRQFGP